MATTGTHHGHGYRVTYATEDDWPVTSIRMNFRKPLPAGVALHPVGAAPWSSGRVGSGEFPTGDASFDRLMTARADREGDLRFLRVAEIRGTLAAALEDHPGLWVGSEAMVVVERGHVRDDARLFSLLDEVAAVAMVLESAGGSSADGARADRAASRGKRGGQAQKGRAAAPRAAKAAVAEAPVEVSQGSSAGPAAVDEFVRSCFDRTVAAYEVNRRIARVWTGRRIVGQGTVTLVQRLWGHDFNFADLKGWKVELRLMGPEEIAPVVRVHVQVDEDAAGNIPALTPGTTARFDGPLASTNPLLQTLQIVSGRVG